MKKLRLLAGGTLAAALLAGCATGPSPAEMDAKANQLIKSSFRDQGIAKTDRLAQDLGAIGLLVGQAPGRRHGRQDHGRGAASR